MHQRFPSQPFFRKPFSFHRIAPRARRKENKANLRDFLYHSNVVLIFFRSRVESIWFSRWGCFRLNWFELLVLHIHFTWSGFPFSRMSRGSQALPKYFSQKSFSNNFVYGGAWNLSINSRRFIELSWLSSCFRKFSAFVINDDVLWEVLKACWRYFVVCRLSLTQNFWCVILKQENRCLITAICFPCRALLIHFMSNWVS